MDASAEFIYIDLETQEAPNHPPRGMRRQDAGIDSLLPTNLPAANERLMALPGEGTADAVEIELDAEQMDALLEGRWVP